jgi:hypothetical protein
MTQRALKIRFGRADVTDGSRGGICRQTLICLLTLVAVVGAVTAYSVAEARILIPMDLTQADHLKAYGVAFHALSRGEQVEWLLNYRGGSFLLDTTNETRRDALLKGVSVQELGPSQEGAIYAEIEQNNMEVVILETPPRIAVYAPQLTNEPWDDAVVLALEYSEIPYEMIYDEAVHEGRLADYDWLHLHHEDFTGQYGKFYAAFRAADWYRGRQAHFEEAAHSAGYNKVWQHKHASVRFIKEYVAGGGFLFAMCSGTDSFDIALASGDVDIVDTVYDGNPANPQSQQLLDFSETLAFENFHLVMNPYEYEFSDIDMSNYSKMRGASADYFVLFEFSAKEDQVPTMLTQCHVDMVNGFLGQTTSYNRLTLKKSTLILGDLPGSNEVKYIHGNYGKGTFTFFGGHDPEDYQHRVGDPPTRLELHKNSPGYRLILNNILFPAAEKKERKT